MCPLLTKIFQIKPAKKYTSMPKIKREDFGHPAHQLTGLEARITVAISAKTIASRLL